MARAKTKTPSALIVRLQRDGRIDIGGGEPPESVQLPTSWVQKYKDSSFITVEGEKSVLRPSRANPETQRGTPIVTAVDHQPVDGQPMPHYFLHLRRIVFHTSAHGDVAYKVTHQPDKYVDSDSPADKVTAELYAEGRTRVDNFYLIEREG